MQVEFSTLVGCATIIREAKDGVPFRGRILGERKEEIAVLHLRT